VPAAYPAGGVSNTANLLSMLQQQPMPAGPVSNYGSYGYSSYQGSIPNPPGMAQSPYGMPNILGSMAGLPSGQLPTGSSPVGSVLNGARAPLPAKSTGAPGSTLTPQQIQQLLSMLPTGANQ
jgi:hypothetical protein